MNKIKTIFVGTPEFSARYLKALLDDERFNIVAVITQADRPVGRKQVLTPPPVKALAQEKDLKIFQPESLKNDSSIVTDLQILNPDLMIVVAYGQIIPQEILSVPKLGAINVHPSLLPKYRGASPIQSALLNGESETGVSIMLMDEKMDHGPILHQVTFELSGEETNDYLHEKIADMTVGLLPDVAARFVDGEIKPVEQDHLQATFCKTISRDDAKIDWSKSAREIKNMVNAFHSWPGTWTTLDGKRVKIFPPVEIIAKENAGIAPGTVEVLDDSMSIICGQGSLKISRLQLEGKNEMTAKEFLQGQKDLTGKVLA